MRHRIWIMTGLVAAVLLLGACGQAAPATPAAPAAPGASSAPAAAPAAPKTPAEINVADLKQKLDAGENFLLLDVRSPEEFTGDGHVAGATLIPLPELESRLAEIPDDQPVVCICRSGNRSSQACNLLAAKGFDATNVQGGMIAWRQSGYPVE